MKVIRRFIYLLYYIKNTENKLFKRFLKYVSITKGRSRISISLDSLKSVFIYNIAIIDYFYFRFFELSEEERKLWAGTGFMYEYQRKMNPPGARHILEDKIQFLEAFKKFYRRKYYTLKDLEVNQKLTSQLLSGPSARLVLKNSLGQVGAQVEPVLSNKFNPKSLLDYMKHKEYDLVEEYVVQHPLLMELSPSGLNTVRIFTQLYEGNVFILGARLRVSVDSPVDNMGAGNLAAEVDVINGEVIGPGVYSDITKDDKEIHPITGKAILGFSIPFWKDVVNLAETAAQRTPENRSVGWDIAITKDGPELIEGNHNWCKLLWQLPVKSGLKDELVRFL